MSFSHDAWNQLKSITADELIRALKKDNWTQDESKSAVLVFRSQDGSKRVTVHYHQKKTHGPKLLKGLLASIGWNEDDMRRIKLIK